MLSFCLVILAIVSICFLVGYTYGGPSAPSVPAGGSFPVDHLDPDNPSYQTVAQETTFDLRSWRPESLQKGEWSSPVVMSDQFTVKKIAPSEAYKVYYATSGTGIDLTCLSHPYHVEIQKAPHNYLPSNSEREYQVVLSGVNAPVGSEDTIRVRGVFYGAFAAKDVASTYTDAVVLPGLKVKLSVLLPDVPVKSLRYTWHKTGGEKVEPLVLGRDAILTKLDGGKRLELTVLKPAPSSVYSINYEFAGIGKPSK